MSESNLQAIQKFLQTLQLKAYSPSAIKTCRNEFLHLLRLLENKSVDELTPEHIRKYIMYCIEKEGLKEATIHSKINAIKFYFEKVLGREKMFIAIPRPKKPLQLPRMLIEEEISRLFNALPYKKHKAILFAAYSAGLRVSEVVHLQLKHIDSGRMQIFVERPKARRIVM